MDKPKLKKKQKDRKNFKEKVEIFLENGADVSLIFSYYCQYSQRFPLLEYLLKNGANPNYVHKKHYHKRCLDDRSSFELLCKNRFAHLDTIKQIFTENNKFEIPLDTLNRSAYYFFKRSHQSICNLFLIFFIYLFIYF